MDVERARSCLFFFAMADMCRALHVFSRSVFGQSVFSRSVFGRSSEAATKDMTNDQTRGSMTRPSPALFSAEHPVYSRPVCSEYPVAPIILQHACKHTGAASPLEQRPSPLAALMKTDRRAHGMANPLSRAKAWPTNISGSQAPACLPHPPLHVGQVIADCMPRPAGAKYFWQRCVMVRIFHALPCSKGVGGGCATPGDLTERCVGIHQRRVDDVDVSRPVGLKAARANLLRRAPVALAITCLGPPAHNALAKRRVANKVDPDVRVATGVALHLR